MSIADMLVSDILETGRTQYPNRAAIVSEQVSRTYSELAERVEHIAGALTAAGVRPQGRIAVLSGNDPVVVEVLLAASIVGAVVVPLNPRITAEDLAFQADDAGVGFAFVQESLEPLARAGGLLDRPSWFCGGDIEKLVVSGECYRGSRPSSNDVLVQLYTSGTTGRPKGCLLTHRGWLSSIGGFAHATGMSTRDVVWPQLPLFHVAGVHFLLTTLATGATYVLDGPGDAARFWQVIRDRSVTIATLFPDPFAVINHPEAQRSCGGLRIAFSQRFNDALFQALPGVTLGTSYGATELAGMAVIAFGEDCARAGAVLGRPLLGMVATVLDDDDRPVPPGATGELCFRGAATTVGYWNLPEASADVLKNGWLHTGDLGRADDDGLLFFVDRKKDMIKPGGENVYSIEVESVLASHSAVVECAVIGVPDSRWGEAVKAVIVASGQLTAAELDRWCIQRLAAYKRPRWYSFVDGLPRNGTAKVIKPDLRAAHHPATSTRLPERS
ncbi:MAG: fatty-acyl-CoA synthase [Mycobacterium sp.]|jgi:acyl-CoA synthetase (AMP-forming)/AMP-acid ligase II|nr:fatty-acyl-CoA synthase [Mycobacterium sp.]MDT7738748.1 fatty-acyl-CoA synthase [Mycobacterium sp.]